MTVATNTYKADIGKVFDIEYGNDMDEYGYITGIELTLDHEKFINLVKNQAFKLIQTTWRNKHFHVITLDHADHIFPFASFKALISSRDDIYPLEYLLKPEFILIENM